MKGKTIYFTTIFVVAITACSHAPVHHDSRYELSVNYKGKQVFGPARIHMEDRTISLDSICPDTPRSSGDNPPAVLNLMLGQPDNGYFYYFCKTSCWFGVGEGTTGKISPGKPAVLDCDDNDLKVTLSEKP